MLYHIELYLVCMYIYIHVYIYLFIYATVYKSYMTCMHFCSNYQNVLKLKAWLVHSSYREYIEFNLQVLPLCPLAGLWPSHLINRMRSFLNIAASSHLHPFLWNSPVRGTASGRYGLITCSELNLCIWVGECWKHKL